MADAFETLSAALERKPTLDIDGTQFAVWLIAIEEYMPRRDNAVRVIVGARHSHTEHHTGELRVARERLDAPDFPDLVRETMERIIRADLPPGALEPL